MRCLAALAMVMMLAGCAHWDWRAAGRSWLESICNSLGNCAVACTGGEADEADGWCQQGARDAPARPMRAEHFAGG